MRSFDNEIGHAYVKMHPNILEEAKKRMDTVGSATKKCYNCFFEIFSQLTEG